MPFWKKNKSFTLIEMMIVIFIIGLLAAIGFPRLAVMIWEARFSEVYEYAGTISRAQTRLYHAKEDYSGPFAESDSYAGFQIPVSKVQEELMVEIPTSAHFKYLIAPTDTDSSHEIYFADIKNGKAWAWGYDYVNNCWKKVEEGDGGRARKYFNPQNTCP